MPNQDLIQSLHELLANCYMLSLKTQNYHWNVTGANFVSLHELFEQQYNELAQANDIVAERIRALGVHVKAGVKYFNTLSVISDGCEALSAPKMLADLLHDHGVIIDLLNKAIALCDNDQATADMLVARVFEHEKTQWMLSSILEL